jgi:very-short-patch-repair endonuclease
VVGVVVLVAPESRPPPRAANEPTPQAAAAVRPARTNAAARRRLEREITGLATRQHRVVARRQLLLLGATPSLIRGWRRHQRLFGIYRGIYSLGPPPLSRPGELMAAVLAGGAQALLSHASAAELWGLTDRRSSVIHLMVAGSSPAGPDGVRIHRSRRPLCSTERATRLRIPVTSLLRTLLDQAGAVRLGTLRRQLEQGDRLYSLDLEAALAACDAAAGRRGTSRLRSLLIDYAGAPATFSELENMLQDLCREYKITPPRCNVMAAGWRVDALWPDARLAVELDSWKFHGYRGQFDRDREKGLALAAAGYELLRLGFRQLSSGRSATAAYLRERVTASE